MENYLTDGVFIPYLQVMGYHQAAGNQAQVWRQPHKTGHVITVHHLTSPPTGLNQTTERRKTGKEKEA